MTLAVLNRPSHGMLVTQLLQPYVSASWPQWSRCYYTKSGSVVKVTVHNGAMSSVTWQL